MFYIDSKPVQCFSVEEVKTVWKYMLNNYWKVEEEHPDWLRILETSKKQLGQCVIATNDLTIVYSEGYRTEDLYFGTSGLDREAGILFEVLTRSGFTDDEVQKVTNPIYLLIAVEILNNDGGNSKVEVDPAVSEVFWEPVPYDFVNLSLQYKKLLTKLRRGSR